MWIVELVADCVENEHGRQEYQGKPKRRWLAEIK